MNWTHRVFRGVQLVILACIAFLPAHVFAANKAMDAARKAAQHGEWEQVGFLVQNVVGADESNADGWALWGDAKLALGDTAGAMAMYETAITHEPRQATSVLALTTHYLSLNKIDEANRVVSAGERRDEKGKIDEIKVARGLILSKQGNFPDALRILATSAEKNPKNYLYQQILARLYNDAGVKEQAKSYYEKAWNLSQKDPQLAFEYGLVLVDLKEYNEALGLLKQVQEADLENKSVDYLIGRLYFAARQWGEAAAQFEAAAKKRPQHYFTHLLLGRSIFEMAKAEKKNYYHQAEISFRKAISLRPDRTDAKPLLGEVLMTQARLYFQRAVASGTDTVPGMVNALCDSSIGLAEESLVLDSTLSGVHSLIARAFNKTGNLDSSIYYSKMQLSITPNDDVEFKRLINSIQRKKDMPGLVETLKPAYEKLNWTPTIAPVDSSSPGLDSGLSIAVKSPEQLFIAGFGAIYVNALMETGANAEARTTINAMIGKDPTWKDGYSFGAYIDLKKENYLGAIPILQAGVKACPNADDLWLLLGDSQYFSNPKSKENIKRARDSYLKAKQLGNKMAAEKYEQLSKY